MDYTAMATQAQAMLERLGQTVTRVAVSTVYNTATGIATPTEVETSRVGVVLSLSVDSEKGVARQFGTMVQKGDKRLLIDGSGPLNIADFVELANGDRYSLVAIEEISPAGTIVIFDAHIRKS